MHEAPLLRVQRARLVQDRVRDRDLADVVQLGRARQHVELLADHPQAPPHRERQRTDAALVLLQVRVALLEGLQQHVAQLLHRARLARLVLAPVQPLVGQLHDRRRVAALRGDAHDAVRRPDREARPALGEGRDAGLHERRVGRAGACCGTARRTRRRPSGRPCPAGATIVLQLVAEARQQRVARRVPEGVVVALEPVQVVQHQLPRLARAGAAAGHVEVFHQLPAVAKAGQRVRQRQPPRARRASRCSRAPSSSGARTPRAPSRSPAPAPAGSAGGAGCRTRTPPAPPAASRPGPTPAASPPRAGASAAATASTPRSRAAPSRLATAPAPSPRRGSCSSPSDTGRPSPRPRSPTCSPRSAATPAPGASRSSRARRSRRPAAADRRSGTPARPPSRSCRRARGQRSVAAPPPRRPPPPRARRSARRATCRCAARAGALRSAAPARRSSTDRRPGRARPPGSRRRPPRAPPSTKSA